MPDYTEKQYLEMRAKVKEDLDLRRDERDLKQVVYVKNKSKRKQPSKRYKSQVSYVFLQYIRIVERWAQLSSGLTLRRVQLLLYLYPLGIFDHYEFAMMCRTVELFDKRVLRQLQEEGWLKVWREKKPKQPELYSFTQKATTLCSRMHLMCLGEEEIPETYNNGMVKSKKVVDKYYLMMVKKFNEKVKENKKPV